MKKAVAFLLACILAASLFTGCSQQTSITDDKHVPSGTDTPEVEGSTEPGTFPISKEKITINIMVPKTASHAKPFNDLDMIKEYEEKTNIHVEWNEVSSEAYEEKYKLILASKNLPDAFGAGFGYDGSVIYKYAKEGIIIPLDDIIEEVGVNTKRFLKEREDFRNLTTYPDGHIYSLPAIDENQNIRIDSLIYINQTYLDILSLEHPKTLDEFGDYLRQVTSKDLNGDGQKEYGLSFRSGSPNLNPITYLFGLFGASWDQNLYLHSTNDDDRLKFAPTMDETRKALEYFNNWYKEGLIDPEIFTQNPQQLKAKGVTEGVAASIVFWYLDLNSGDESKNEYRVLNMMEGPNGDKLWRRNGLIPGYNPNQFFITNANKYPKETIRYIDYWMDNSDNALTNRFGPQEYSWDYLDDGTWTELPNIPTGEVRTMENSTLFCTWAHGIPYWCFADFWRQKTITAPTALERAKSLDESYIPVATPGLPVLIYEEAENKEALAIKTDLFSYVDTQVAKFITEGVTDETWNAYSKKTQSLKADRWVELYQKYYDNMRGK